MFCIETALLTYRNLPTSCSCFFVPRTSAVTVFFFKSRLVITGHIAVNDKRECSESLLCTCLHASKFCLHPITLLCLYCLPVVRAARKSLTLSAMFRTGRQTKFPRWTMWFTPNSKGTGETDIKVEKEWVLKRFRLLEERRAFCDNVYRDQGMAVHVVFKDWTQLSICIHHTDCFLRRTSVVAVILDNRKFQPVSSLRITLPSRAS